VRALAKTLPLPADLGELNLLLDGVLRDDPVSLARFKPFAGTPRDYTQRRQERTRAFFLLQSDPRL
jgi:hypothetical protein